MRRVLGTVVYIVAVAGGIDAYMVANDHYATVLAVLIALVVTAFLATIPTWIYQSTMRAIHRRRRNRPGYTGDPALDDDPEWAEENARARVTRPASGLLAGPGPDPQLWPRGRPEPESRFAGRPTGPAVPPDLVRRSESSSAGGAVVSGDAPAAGTTVGDAATVTGVAMVTGLAVVEDESRDDPTAQSEDDTTADGTGPDDTAALDAGVDGAGTGVDAGATGALPRPGAEVVADCEARLAEAERVFGPTDPQTFAARLDLAAAYWALGQLDRATAAYEEITADCEQALGETDPQTLTCRSSLASAYEMDGRLDEAIALYQYTLDTREGVLGPAHPDTETSRRDLAIAQAVQANLNRSRAES